MNVLQAVAMLAIFCGMVAALAVLAEGIDRYATHWQRARQQPLYDQEQDR